jgi:hypothetical protein
MKKFFNSIVSEPYVDIPSKSWQINNYKKFADVDYSQSDERVSSLRKKNLFFILKVSFIGAFVIAYSFFYLFS